MGKYQGDEQTNPILQYIRSKNLYLDHSDEAYQLWNAAKQGVPVGGLQSEDAKKWFGDSLFTTNVRMYISWDVLRKMHHFFQSYPQRPVYPSSPTVGSYEVFVEVSSPPPYESCTPEEIHIERYAAVMAFFSQLVGALDIMTVGLAFLYQFANLDPLKIDFGQAVKFLDRLMNANNLPNQLKPARLISVFQTEGLFGNQPSCAWYNDVRGQRNYYTHLGFPLLYVENGEWRLPVDARAAMPQSNLTDDIPRFCERLCDGVHEFIGKVYECMWDDFRQKLP